MVRAALTPALQLIEVASGRFDGLQLDDPVKRLPEQWIAGLKFRTCTIQRKTVLNVFHESRPCVTAGMQNRPAC